MNEILALVAQIRYRIFLSRDLLQLYYAAVIEKGAPLEIDQKLHEFMVECEKIVLDVGQQKISIPEAMKKASEVKSNCKSFVMRQIGVNIIDLG